MHQLKLSTMLLLLLTLVCFFSAGHTVDVKFKGRLAYIVSASSPHLPAYEVPQLPWEATKPRNVHLSFGATERHIVITWSTIARVSLALARYRPQGEPAQWQTAKAASTKFVDGGKLKASQWIHRARLPILEPGVRYEYQVSGGETASNWSMTFDFRVPGRSKGGLPAADESRSFAVYGDFGLENAQSLPRLYEDAVQKRRFDAILHVGDFAYDMADENGSVGDRFMQMLQPIAARLPYLTCVGNHEQLYNFSHYRYRFSMPGNTESLFYSVNIGPVHLVSISNEFYFFTNYGTMQLERQFRWLEDDLRQANRNRTATPWIVMIGHRPMYCSNIEPRDCKWGARTLRRGFKPDGRWALEPLLLRHGVDLAFWGHEHSYERTWPVYNGQVVKEGASLRRYDNPRAPLHVITGSAGNKEKHAYFTKDAPKFSAFRSTDYGYTRVTFYNASHAYLEQVSDDKAGEVIDSFTVLQKRHGSFSIR